MVIQDLENKNRLCPPFDHVFFGCDANKFLSLSLIHALIDACTCERGLYCINNNDLKGYKKYHLESL